ncbi:MAG: hypothetical protein KJ556_20185 [Gammaproteobacteria bacterium]|nr:hypothetical protein [Gammaproteobacteria bacterium]
MTNKEFAKQDGEFLRAVGLWGEATGSENLQLFVKYHATARQASKFRNGKGTAFKTLYRKTMFSGRRETK